MRRIREGAFETNSSSMHSFTTNEAANYKAVYPNEGENFLVLELGDFGWGYESYTSVEVKLSYIATYIVRNLSEREDFEACHVGLEDETYYRYVGNNSSIQQFIEELKEHSGTTEIYFEILYDSYGYCEGSIDHQSTDVAAEAFSNWKSFALGTSTLIIDNDNH